MTDRPKISVIVAAYCPGDGIERVIRSLDAQTLPQDEFETIIVDDGSPDDTFERLQGYAATRPNLRITRIENSGWPSRPRNLATEMARGEWLLFMDHDDSLYPDALRRAAEYAAETSADVLSPKESKTSDVWWSMPSLVDGNIPNALTGGGIDRLLPMVPHKFYRREFLLEHGIRFPEGRRMLWEDIYVNVAAWRHARVVSVLADTPVYLWHSSTSNNSKTYGPRGEEFWDRLDQLFAFIDETLDTPEHAEARRSMLLHQYRGRVLGRLSRMLPGATAEETSRAMASARDLQERHIPEEWDGLLGSYEETRALLLRQGRPDLLLALHHSDGQLVASATTETTEWRDGVLHLSVRAGWNRRSGGPAPLLRRGGRVVRDVPAEVARVVPPEVLDLTDRLDGFSVSLGVRSRFDRVTWELAHSPQIGFETVESGVVTPVARTAVEVDLGSTAMGRPLEATVWDLFSAIRWQGVSRGTALRSSEAARAALVDGRAAVAYANLRGNLSLDAQGLLRNVVKDARPSIDDVAGTVGRLVIALPDVHIHGRTDLRGDVTFAPLIDTRGTPAGDPVVVPGRVRADEQGARLEAGGSVPSGTYRLSFQVGEGAPLESVFVAKVDVDGDVEVIRRPPPAPKQPLGARLRRGVDGLLGRARSGARSAWHAARSRS